MSVVVVVSIGNVLSVGRPVRPVVIDHKASEQMHQV